MSKYLSIDTETTGLSEDSLIIEFGCVPVNVKTREIRTDLAFQTYIKCPSFEELTPFLSPFALKNNKSLIDKAHKKGISLNDFKFKLSEYLSSPDISKFFEEEKGKQAKVKIMGKSLSALDLPLMNRDLGWEYMREKFSHQNLDITSVAMTMIDKGLLPSECASSTQLAKYLLKKTDVAHTSVSDAVDVANMYFKLLDLK